MIRFQFCPLLCASTTLIISSLHFGGSAQSIVVEPYLQNASPTSMTIMWETNAANPGYIDWGTTDASLSTTVISTSLNGEGANKIHTVEITGLSADTKYFYQARTTTGQLSATYHFKTHPTKTSETSVNFVAMSDMQRDNANPNVFETIINSGIIPMANANYPNGMEDIEAILIPGDLVATGTYSAWRDTYFAPSVGISPYVPTYPVPGNHEYYGFPGSSLFFDYTTLPLNGSPSNPEEWWYKDISNMRVIGLNSNSPIPELAIQLIWLQTVLDDAGTDPTIDFVFAQLHHPYKSELWLPGELDFTGQIIALLETFSTSHGKPSVHFFGHTHAYSRGQSRDHNHLWVNVATAGGAIDNWGEFPNADYDEFVISEDEYGFVMVEVEAGATPKFVLKRYSQGDNLVFENNTLSDQITIKRYPTAPNKPLGISPAGQVDLNCILLKASPFSDSANTHQAAHWQIVEGCDFTTPSVQNIWKQSTNWYSEINTQANDDLTDEDGAALNASLSYCWRVRYRNSNLTWSDWSAPLSFTTGPVNYVTSNILLNGDAETGIVNWTGNIESLTDNECGSIPVYQGTNFFAVGGVCVNEQTTGFAKQTIDVSTHAVQIDDGKFQVEYGGYLRTWGLNNDLPEMYIEFLNASNNLIGTTSYLSNNTAVWINTTGHETIPMATRKLRVVLKGTRLAGTDNDSYFDELSLRLIESDCSSIGLNELFTDEKVSIYPNPTNGELFYETLENYQQISIVDQLGREVFSTNVSAKTGDLSLAHLAVGTYTITFINENEKRSVTFIKRD